MKEVVISADGDSCLYAVPDVVAENLASYCMEFCDKWLWESPDAEKFRIKGGMVCYDETDFIDYLNEYIFPDERSVLVKNLGWTELGAKLPDEYRELPRFNF